MSEAEEDKAHTATLLPTARVALFTRDEQTKSSFLALADDWRYARVTLEVHDGDADTAIAMYKDAGTPHLVIVQTDSTDDAFLTKLETLSGCCSEGTAAIVIGPINDVNLYRKLVGMGVSDYMVRPVTTEQFGDDIAGALVEQIGASGSRLIVFIGAKGGVGVTSLVEGLAWGLSDTMGQKTFLLDSAGGWSSLSVGMDFEPATTLAEAVRASMEGSEDSLSRMMFHASEKLTVLSSGGDVMLDDVVSTEGFETLLDHLMITYPVVLLDVSASPASLKRTALARAHEIVLVTTPALSAIRAARTLLQEIKQLRGGADNAVDVIVNMEGLAPKYEVPKGQIEAGLERKDITHIAFDPVLFVNAESKAAKLGEEKGGDAIVDKLLLLARKVLGTEGGNAMVADDAGKQGALGGLLHKLKAK